MIAVRWRLLPFAAVATAAMAAAPAPAPAPPPPPPDTSTNDESLIEFLGADDVGDVGWWDYLKRSEPGPVGSPPPPQGVKQ